MLTIVDYGLGNIGSLTSMFKHLRIDVAVSSIPSEIEGATKLILPGVGAFGHGMRSISSVPGLRDSLDRAVTVDQTPILGICLGMQLMMSSSDEDDEEGLSWINAHVQRFPQDTALKVPNMGWSVVKKVGSSALISDLKEPSKFYFVHSYYVPEVKTVPACLIAHHGIDFVAAFEYRNFFGVQFHPEKSHRFGMTILRNFANL